MVSRLAVVLAVIVKFSLCVNNGNAEVGMAAKISSLLIWHQNIAGYSAVDPYNAPLAAHRAALSSSFSDPLHPLFMDAPSFTG